MRHDAQTTEMQERRLARLAKEIGWIRRETAERLAATRRIFGRRVCATAIHTHSTHSDGTDPVAANYAAAMQAGLDFMFATDHFSLKQKRNVRTMPRASWGQEPGAGGHHIGLLHGRRLFRPRKQDFARNFQTARQLAPFVWVPHPVGWYPSQWYADDRIAQLWTLGDAFAMEVINGANKVFQAFDAFDAKAVAVWDRLLCDGKRVTALGASDAHIAEDVGMAWTGVYAARCAAPAILRALNAGECFASESSLLEFECNRRPMGAAVRRKSGAALRLRFRAADAAGIESARLVGAGRVLRELNGKNQPLLAGDFSLRPGRRTGYLRFETTAADGRRAFSSPVYLLPA